MVSFNCELDGDQSDSNQTRKKTKNEVLNMFDLPLSLKVISPHILINSPTSSGGKVIALSDSLVTCSDPPVADVN